MEEVIEGGRVRQSILHAALCLLEEATVVKSESPFSLEIQCAKKFLNIQNIIFLYLLDRDRTGLFVEAWQSFVSNDTLKPALRLSLT